MLCCSRWLYIAGRFFCPSSTSPTATVVLDLTRMLWGAFVSSTLTPMVWTSFLPSPMAEYESCILLLFWKGGSPHSTNSLRNRVDSLFPPLLVVSFPHWATCCSARRGRWCLRRQTPAIRRWLACMFDVHKACWCPWHAAHCAFENFWCSSSAKWSASQVHRQQVQPSAIGTIGRNLQGLACNLFYFQGGLCKLWNINYWKHMWN